MSWVMVGVAAANLIGGASAKKKGKKRDAQAFAERTAQAAPLIANADKLQRGSRDAATGLQRLAIRAATKGREGERQEALGQASADVAILAGRSPTSLSGVMDRALTRARGMSRLARHTSDEFDNSLLKERLSLVAGGRQRQATGLMGVLDSVGLRAGTLAAGAASREASASARENIFGTAAGLGISAIPEMRDWNQRRRMLGTSQPGVSGGGFDSSGMV